jgi:hypothetical protein
MSGDLDKSAPPGYYIPGTRVGLEPNGLAARMNVAGMRESTHYEEPTHSLLDYYYWLLHRDPKSWGWLQNFTAGYNDLGPPPLLVGRKK